MVDIATKLVTKTLPILVDLIETLEPMMQPLLDGLTSLVGLLGELIKWLKEKNVGENFKRGLDRAGDTIRGIFGGGDDKIKVGVSGHARADGGIASIPTIVGERGPEMVIPLDFARSGRANNLVQTFNQTFNLAQNQTTASSLAATMRANGRWGR